MLFVFFEQRLVERIHARDDLSHFVNGVDALFRRGAVRRHAMRREQDLRLTLVPERNHVVARLADNAKIRLQIQLFV
ncbi:hypothetical protein SDC9_172487 [bioreactor metagenome]|uniref:Uncharacterized protein n=1 Tax=bioreactor metagenome TaxID=1076179 RepID=A0A645GG24_9ZZZZ